MTSSLKNFTDILDDVRNESQPLSLSLESATQNNNNETRQAFQDWSSKNFKPPKGTGQKGEFRSVEEIDPKYRVVFTYPYFNLVQSKVIEDALYSDKSMVLCAPTGSGKTVIFEMAIVRLLMELEDTNSNEDYKIIYMAPVKALCTERLTEWYPKFNKLGLMCIEVTGDTDVDFLQLKPYRIIITTPEKWDMLTRRWRDHRGLVEMIKLFLIDEVHILNDVSRGPVLEAVVSRMKTIESAAQSAHRIEQLQNEYHGTEISYKTAPKIRFVAVSATISNPEDVASWLGTDTNPAVFYKFGDECRPVKLKRVVEGYPCPDGMSIFKFDIVLNYKLWPIIQKYHNGKPTLIFCNTRKSVLLTAETLSRELTINFDPQQKARLTTLASTIKNKKLQTLLLNGVGCHHAGLLYEERTNIEKAFRNRDVPILITTTTLAMGVNLPAHLVIIKNTQQYVNGAYQEYSISTVLQMVGRAGRPQFDTEAVAVIMTTIKDKPRYQALVGGSEPLQSYLHKRLAENLNSEAALGTVSDVAQCVQWLRSTFLYVRAGRDPKRYLGLPPVAPQHQISKKIEELCVKAMNGLASSRMITMDEACCIQSTEAGRLMSIYYLDLDTMKHIMKIEGTETLDQLLWIVCECHELADMHLRMDERRLLNALNRNSSAATIRFPMKGKITTRQMKLNCVIQAVLGCLPIPDPSMNQEAMKIMRIADRICKCIVAYVTRPELTSVQPKFYSAVLNSLILAKCVSAQLWENSPYVSKQLRGIGPTFSNLLATAGKVNFMLLEESHPRDLERIINKGPPIGNVLHKLFTLLPKYQVTITPIDQHNISVQLILLNQAYLSEHLDQLTAGNSHKCYIVVGDSENNLHHLSTFKDSDLINVYDGSITYQIARKHNFEHTIFAHCISASFVGIDARCEYLVQSIEPPSSQINNPVPNTIKKVAKKQTTITDTFKERKRKNTDEITHSKEKKKQISAIIEKFHNLKESFGIASKEMKEELHKTADMKNEILNTFMKPPAHITLKRTNEINMPNEDVAQKVANIQTVLDIDMEEKSDNELHDEKIDNILQEIENEMSSLNDKSKEKRSDRDKIFTTYNNNIGDQYLSKLNYTPSHGSCSGRNMKRPNTKYNFIKLLEKNTDLSDDEDSVILNKTEDNNGFSNTIKAEVEKYLKNTYNFTKPTDKIIEELHSEPEIPNVSMNQSLGNVTEFKPVNSKNNFLMQENNKPVEKEVSYTTNNPIDKMDTNYFNYELLYNSFNGDDENISNNKIYNEIETDKNKLSKPLDNLSTNSPKMLVPLIKTCSSPTEFSVEFDSHFNEESNNVHNSENKQLDEKQAPINDKALTVVNLNNNNKNCATHNLQLKNDTLGFSVENTCNENLTILAKNQFYELPPSNKSYMKFLKEVKNLKCENNLTSDKQNTYPISNSASSNERFATPNNRLQDHSESLEFFSQNQINDKSILLTSKENQFCQKFETTLTSSSNFIQMKNNKDLNNEYSLELHRKSANMQNNENSSSYVKLPLPNRECLESASDNVIEKSNNNCRENCMVSDNMLNSKMPSTSFYQNKSNTENEIRKYSYSITNIDYTTKNMPDHFVRVTRKLKVDVDITEVVSKKGVNNRNINTNKKILGKPDIDSNKQIKERIIDLNKREAISYSVKDDKPCLIKNNFKDNDISVKDITEEDDQKIYKKPEDNTNHNSTLDQTSVAQILQKHFNTLRKKAGPVNNQTEVKANNSTKLSPTKIKPKRPFKINQIHNIDTPLPENLIEQSQYKIDTESHQPNILHTINNVPNYVTAALGTKEVENHLGLPPEILENNSEYEDGNHLNLCMEDNDDLQIDQSMFNPKVLIQSLNAKDAEIIIPPPPGFEDDTHVSNVDEDVCLNVSNLLENANVDYNSNTLPNVEKIDPTSNEFETWVFSNNPNEGENSFSPFATQNQYFSRNHLFSSTLASRRQKLNKFSYSQKEKLKK